MVDYDKDFIFYDDSDDELVDVSNGIKTAEESANSKNINKDDKNSSNSQRNSTTQNTAQRR